MPRNSTASKAKRGTGTIEVRAVIMAGGTLDPSALEGLPPLPDGRVVLDGPDGQGSEIREGKATLAEVPAGPHTLTVQPPQGFGVFEGYLPQGAGEPTTEPLDLEVGATVEIVVGCLPLVHVVGEVRLRTPDGEDGLLDGRLRLPVRGAFDPQRTVTADNGQVDEWVAADEEVDIVPPCPLSAGDLRVAPDPPTVTVGPDEEPFTVVYQQAAVIRAAGSFDDPDDPGRRVAGVRFWLAADDDPDKVLRQITTTAQHPVATFDDLCPGTYRVTAGRRTVDVDQPLELSSPSSGFIAVSVRAGDMADLTDQFLFQSLPAAITGEVRSRVDGRPLIGLGVRLLDPLESRPDARTWTDNDGRYRFAGVQAGFHLVGLLRPAIDSSGAFWQPVPPDNAERPVLAPPGEVVEVAPIELDPRPGRVSGSVLGPDRAGIAGVQLVLEPADGGAGARTRISVADGRFDFGAIPPGRYLLRLPQVPVEVGGQPFVLAAGQLSPQELQVVSGSPTDVELVLEPAPSAGTVTGRVVDALGNGLRNVTLSLGLPGLPDAQTNDRGVYRFDDVPSGLQVVGLSDLQPNAAVRRALEPDRSQRSLLVVPGGVHQVPDIMLREVQDPAEGTLVALVLTEDGESLDGVKLVVRPSAGGASIAEDVTNDRAGVSITVPVGTWAIGPDELPIRVGDVRWRPKDPDRGVRVVTVDADETVTADPIVVERVRAVLEITGTVRDAASGQGLGGVPLQLRSRPGGIRRFTVTDNQGHYAFEDVQRGRYVVALDHSPFEVGGVDYEPVVGDDGTRLAEVKDTSVQVDPPLLVQPESHRIFGTVTGPNGSPVSFLPIRILDDQGELEIALETDLDGRYEANVDEAGRYVVEFQTDGRPVRRTVTLASGKEVSVRVDDAGDGAVTRVTQDLGTFPLLTESVSLPAGPSPLGAPPPTSVTQTVQEALRQALGWRPREADPRGFTAALTQSFERHEVMGHTEAVWTPRSYAVALQADLGQITGAQASVYNRAKVAVDAALPLLDGLYPLDPKADPEDVESMRAIVRTELEELVAELGMEGGPRLGRLDQLLDLLLGDRDGVVDASTVQGQLAKLRDRFGLFPEQANTVDEEQNLTNFIILVDYVNGLDTSWTAQRTFFANPASTQAFLGTQLILLSRSLAVVSESVTQVGFALDSVFVGAAERQALRLSFDDEASPILLADLLDWVERVASSEGLRLLQDSGKDGAETLKPILDRLRGLVQAALTVPFGGEQSPGDVPAGYATARVQQAMLELAKYLADSAQLAGAIKRSGAGNGQ